MDSETIDWFTFAVLEYAEEERYREKIRRSLLDLVTRHPGDGSRVVFRALTESAREIRRYLWSTFGYDVRRNRWRRGSVIPTSELGWVRLWRWKKLWQKKNALIGAWLLGASEAYLNGQDVALGGAREFVKAEHMLIWPDGCDIVLVPWLDIRLEALACFSGTLLARINLARNHRLRSALTPGSLRDQRIELARRLPGAVDCALHAGGPHEHPQTVMNRAVRLLEYEHRPRRSYRPRRSKLDGDPASWPERPREMRARFDPLPTIVSLLLDGFDPSVVDEALREQGEGTLEQHLARLTPELLQAIGETRGIDVSSFVVPLVEQFAAREDAAASSILSLDSELLEAASDLAARHGMSDRQAQVFALKGADLTHREIGSLLGIAVGTSKALLHKATRKLGRTA